MEWSSAAPPGREGFCNSNGSRAGVPWPFPASHSTSVPGLCQDLPVPPPFPSFTSSKPPLSKTQVLWGKKKGGCTWEKQTIPFKNAAPKTTPSIFWLTPDPFQGCQGVLPPFIFKAGRCSHPGSSLLPIGPEIYLSCAFLTGSSVVLALNLHGNPCSRDTEWKPLAWGGQQQNTDLPECL